MNRRVKIIIPTILIVGIILMVVYNILSRRVQYNPENAVGNTAGNLYNGGLFCEYKGYVYFSNPFDNEYLYRMKADGSKVQRIVADKASYINVYGKYIYYKRHNYDSSANKVLKGNLYGLYRIDTNGKYIKCLHRGIIGSIALSGNYLYYQAYEKNTFAFDIVKIDGKEFKEINKKNLMPVLIYDNNVMYVETEKNHNLMVFNKESGTGTTYYEGNLHMPQIYEDNIYYIDCDNGRRLTKASLSTGEKTILSEDRVIAFNMDGKLEVIYYQVENEDIHRLMKCNLSGEYKQQVGLGDYDNISITSKYTYFYKIIGDERTLYRTPTVGIADPEVYKIGKS